MLVDNRLRDVPWPLKSSSERPRPKTPGSRAFRAVSELFQVDLRTGWLMVDLKFGPNMLGRNLNEDHIDGYATFLGFSPLFTSFAALSGGPQAPTSFETAPFQGKNEAIFMTDLEGERLNFSNPDVTLPKKPAEHLAIGCCEAIVGYVALSSFHICLYLIIIDICNK